MAAPALSTCMSPAALRAISVMACVISTALMIQSGNGQQWEPCAGAHSCHGNNACGSQLHGCCGTRTCGSCSQHCGNNCCSQCSCNYCGARCGGCNCFPATAKVMTRGGTIKPMSELVIGEEVAVRNGSGGVEYDAVYAHGNADPHTFSEFIALTLSSLQHKNVIQTIQLTPAHLTIVEGFQNALEYKVAKDVKVGDRMLTIGDHDLKFSTFAVSGIKTQVMKGLYKPITSRGTIVVNNVLASCHSESFIHYYGAHALPSI